MMTSDEYVRRIIAKYKVPNEVDALTQCFVVNPLINMIKEWAGDCLNDIQISGSRAKGTAMFIPIRMYPCSGGTNTAVPVERYR
jgi:hypothetical protein